MQKSDHLNQKLLDVSSDSNVTLRPDGSDFVIDKLEVTAVSNLAFGIGYKFMDTYSLEMRYQPNRKVLSKNANWSSDYTTLSMIFGYSFF